MTIERQPQVTPAPKVIRAWAQENGYDVPIRGRIPAYVLDAWQAHQARAAERRPTPVADEPEFAKSDHRRQIEQLVKAIPLTLASEHSTLDRLDLATSIIEQAELWRDELVKTARSIGESWTAIGHNTGMTKQAAHKRWSTPVRSESTIVDTEPMW